MIYFCEMQQKIVLIGGPGTGKTTIINELIKRDFHCMPEVSRDVILKAKKQGVEQLFLTEPQQTQEKKLFFLIEEFLMCMHT
jgi:predicted ATPase